MASLAELLLGKDNPVTQWTGRNSNLLTGLGTSLLSDGMNFQPAQVGATLDRQAAAQKDADAKLAASTNATIDYFARKYPDLAEKARAGAPISELWQESLARDQAAMAGPEMTANMRDYQFAQANPGYADFLNPPSAGNQPASVQEYEYAKAQGFNGSLIDFEKAKASAGRAAMNPTTQKELFEAEDAAKAGDYVLSALDEAIKLNDTAYDGPFADARGDAMALVGDQSGVATARMKNVTTELALSQLKTIFGSMPTEGERKILLELQGSVNQARPVRAAILKRAREMAERRIADSKAKADALRSGAYFDPGYGQPAMGGADPDVDAILQQYGVP